MANFCREGILGVQRRLLPLLSAALAFLGLFIVHQLLLAGQFSRRHIKTSSLLGDWEPTVNYKDILSALSAENHLHFTQHTYHAASLHTYNLDRRDSQPGVLYPAVQEKEQSSIDSLLDDSSGDLTHSIEHNATLKHETARVGNADRPAGLLVVPKHDKVVASPAQTTEETRLLESFRVRTAVMRSPGAMQQLKHSLKYRSPGTHMEAARRWPYPVIPICFSCGPSR